MKRLIIGSFVLPAEAGLDLSQRYEELGPETILRTSSGRAIKQATWRKRRIVTQGSGWVPPGLGAIDTVQQHVVQCILAVSLPADPVTRQVTLPAARRTDIGHVPFGQAEMANGQIAVSPVAMVGNVATVAEVVGAVRYQIGYYPALVCWVNRPSLTGPEGYGWEITAEEV